MRRVLSSLAVLLIAAQSVGAVAAPHFTLKRISLPTALPTYAPEANLVVAELGMAFFAVPDERRIYVLDTRRDELLEHLTIDLGPDPASEPRILTYDPVRRWLVVVSVGVARAFSLDGRTAFTLQAETFYAELALPKKAVFDPVRRHILILDPGSSSRHIDPSLRTIDSSFNVETRADFFISDLHLDLAGGRIFAADRKRGEGKVRVLSADDLLEQEAHPSSSDVSHVLYQPAGERVYTLIQSVGLFQWIDLRTGENWPIGVGVSPTDLAFDQARDLVYVANSESLFLSRIDGAQIAAGAPESRISMPVPSFRLLLDQDTGLLYTAEPRFGRSHVSVVDTTVEPPVFLTSFAADPKRMVLDPASHKLYASDGESASVLVLAAMVGPGGSRVEVSDEGIPADASSTSTVTVTLIESGTPVPGRDVVIHTTAGTLLGDVFDHDDGRYTQALESTDMAETAIVSATADLVALEDRPRVSFEIDGWPTIRDSDPDWGITGGGEPVIVVGDGFAGGEGLEVYFGSDALGWVAASIDSYTDTEIVVASPPHDAGVVDVRVDLLLSDERRSSYLRGGFTYVETEQLTLLVTKGPQPNELEMTWSSGPTGLVTLESSSSRSFAGPVSQLQQRDDRETVLAPLHPQLTFYRVTR